MEAIENLLLDVDSEVFSKLEQILTKEVFSNLDQILTEVFGKLEQILIFLEGKVVPDICCDGAIQSIMIEFISSLK